MFQKHAQERRHRRRAGWRQGYVAVQMLFEPFKELWNKRSYFGSEIWDTNAPGYQQVQQALRRIVSQQLLPMSVSGAQRAEESMGVEPKWYPTTKEGALSYLGFGPAPK